MIDVREKQELRDRIKDVLRSVSSVENRRASIVVTKNVLNSEAWKSCPVVLSFVSINGEIDTSMLIQVGLDQGKIVGVPRTAGSYMTFHRIRKVAFPSETGLTGVREPTSAHPAVEPGQELKFPEIAHRPEYATRDTPLSLVVVPGLAFDRRGNRLGRGGGAYDRYLARYSAKVVTIGVCLERQIVDAVPVGKQDIGVSYIATENGMYTTREL